MESSTKEGTAAGICSQCHKVWTLKERQGVCQWCGKPANSLSGRTRTRPLKSGRGGRRKPQLDPLGYDGLAGDWLARYRVAARYESKVPVEDRDDYRHDCMLELLRAEARDGHTLDEPRAWRIAALMVSLYYRKLNAHLERVCLYQGYPTTPHCRKCEHHSDRPRCDWLAVRPLERLDREILDDEGYSTRLLDTIASQDPHDMPDVWLDLKTMTDAVPLRLAEIAYKRLEGTPLSASERQYLHRIRKSEQKSLV